MTTYVFDKVELRAVKAVPCTVCGRKVRRQRTLWQTESPFNLNARGRAASRREIREKLQVLAVAWQAEPETHPACAS